MYSNLNSVTWTKVVDIAKLKADTAKWTYDAVSVSHPLAGKVGWFNINNISAGLFGMPVGFVTIFIVSLLTPAPSQKIRDLLDDVLAAIFERMTGRRKSDSVSLGIWLVCTILLVVPTLTRMSG